jgi:hypothetical protein
MKLGIINAALLLSLSQLSFAEGPEQPDSCPSVSAIQAVGINEVINEQGSWYGAVSANNYDTADQWTFAIGEFKAPNQKKAKQKILEAMNSLSYQFGPEAFEVNGQDSWVCLYADNAGHRAITVTPTLSVLKLGILRH